MKALRSWWSYSNGAKFSLFKELMFGPILNVADVGTDANAGKNHFE